MLNDDLLKEPLDSNEFWEWEAEYNNTWEVIICLACGVFVFFAIIGAIILFIDFV